MDQLVKQQKIEGKIAAAKLIALLGLQGEKARHLPRELAKAYIKRWQSP
jgi:hypothetical protein